MSVTRNSQTIFLQKNSSHSMLSFHYMTSWMTPFSFFRYFTTKSQFQAFQNCFYAKMTIIEVVQNYQGNILTKLLNLHHPPFLIYDVFHDAILLFFASVSLKCCFQYLSWFLGKVNHKLEFLKMIAQAFLR